MTMEHRSAPYKGGLPFPFMCLQSLHVLQMLQSDVIGPSCPLIFSSAREVSSRKHENKTERSSHSFSPSFSLLRGPLGDKRFIIVNRGDNATAAFCRVFHCPANHQQAPPTNVTVGFWCFFVLKGREIKGNFLKHEFAVLP